jgi:hypothetical protein
MLFSLDNNWCYTSVNSKAGEILGKNQRDYWAKNIWEEQVYSIELWKNG